VTYTLDWASAFRADILKYGMRNSTLTAMNALAKAHQFVTNSTRIGPVRVWLLQKNLSQGILKNGCPRD